MLSDDERARRLGVDMGDDKDHLMAMRNMSVAGSGHGYVLVSQHDLKTWLALIEYPNREMA